MSLCVTVAGKIYKMIRLKAGGGGVNRPPLAGSDRSHGK